MGCNKFDVLKRFITLIDIYGAEKSNSAIDEIEQKLSTQVNSHSEIIINAICEVFAISRCRLIRNNTSKLKRRTPNEADAYFYCIWLFFASKKFSLQEISTTLNVSRDAWDNFYRKQKTFSPDNLNTKIPIHRELLKKFNKTQSIINQSINSNT